MARCTTDPGPLFFPCFLRSPHFLGLVQVLPQAFPSPAKLSLPLLVILINTPNKRRPSKRIQDSAFGCHAVFGKTDTCINFVICPGEIQLRLLPHSAAIHNIMDIFSVHPLVK
jgi:hypothetical protein